MTSTPAAHGPAAGPAVSGASTDGPTQEDLLSLMAIKGEGDAWDFKLTLGDLSSTVARVELAKDALAFCNLPQGGHLVIGVTKQYERVGLALTERIDTTIIRKAIEKYLDGDFVVSASEYDVQLDGESGPRRFGIVRFRRRHAQPVLAALSGDADGAETKPVFRQGDVLIRRGAQSIRANSGDLRQLFTNTLLGEKQIAALETVWRSHVD